MKQLFLFLLLVSLFAACSTTKVATTGSTSTADSLDLLGKKKPVKRDTTFIHDTLRKTWCCKVDTLHRDSIIRVPKKVDSPYVVPVPKYVVTPVPVDSPYFVPRPIPKDSFYTVYKPKYKDTLIHRDSIVWDFKDSTRWTTKDSTRWHTNDSTRWTTKDSIRWHIIDKDSIRWHPIDSCREDTVGVIKSTKFGALLEDQDDVVKAEARLKKANLNIIRLSVFYYVRTNTDKIDQALKDGFQVQINFGWKTTASPITFCTDTAFIRKQAEAFFKYYAPKKSQIPFVAIENEWDNGGYRDFTKTRIEDYIMELKICTEVGHKYGFKIADGGITGNGLARWTYSKLNQTEAKAWVQKYYVNPTSTNYKPMLDLINKYIDLVKAVPIDYLCSHWYNRNGCFNGYPVATAIYSNLIGKHEQVNNEFGIMEADMNEWLCTIQELQTAGMIYGIAYSGVNNPDRAVLLNDDFLAEMGKR